MGFIHRFIDILLEETLLMSTLTDIQDAVTVINNTLLAVDAKLTDIAALIATLQAGQVDQAQIDALATAVGAAKDEATKVLTEAGAIV